MIFEFVYRIDLSTIIVGRRTNYNTNRVKHFTSGVHIYSENGVYRGIHFFLIFQTNYRLRALVKNCLVIIKI